MYEADVIESICLPLVWLLSTPNRIVRDHTTKVISGLLRAHLGVALKLVERFSAVDDPYLHERLSALACHGAVLRGGHRDMAGGRDLFDGMVRVWLSDKYGRPDALTRDAVRGVGEWLHGEGLIYDAELAGVSPPYESKPLGNQRSDTWLEAQYPSSTTSPGSATSWSGKRSEG